MRLARVPNPIMPKRHSPAEWRRAILTELRELPHVSAHLRELAEPAEDLCHGASCAAQHGFLCDCGE